MVATDMGKAGFELLAKQGIDLSAHIISVEQSTNGIKNVIENASLESTNGKKAKVGRAVCDEGADSAVVNGRARSSTRLI